MSVMLKFSEKECESLLGILEARLGTLRAQDYQSEMPRFKDGLKAEEVLLNRLLTEVRNQQSSWQLKAS